MVFGSEYTEFSRPRHVLITSAQLGSVEADGFYADEDPVFGWEGRFRIGVINGEA